MAHAHPTAMLESTLQTLQQRGTAPSTGAELVKDWISALKHYDGVEPVVTSLQNLYDALVNPSPNAVQVKTLLDELAQYTANFARQASGPTAGSLQQVASALQAFGTDLDRI